MSQTHKAVGWALAAMLSALLTYLSFRGYLTPELLLHFANHLTC